MNGLGMTFDGGPTTHTLARNTNDDDSPTADVKTRTNTQTHEHDGGGGDDERDDDAERRTIRTPTASGDVDARRGVFIR